MWTMLGPAPCFAKTLFIHTVPGIRTTTIHKIVLKLIYKINSQYLIDKCKNLAAFSLAVLAIKTADMS